MNLERSIADLQGRGFCILRAQIPVPKLAACREAFWPVLQDYLKTHCELPNRGRNRHFLPMPFEPPCYAPEFFFDRGVLRIVRHVMNTRLVADQWGCDVAVTGSEYQQFHVDYERPLFEEAPDLPLPTYMLIVSFPLVGITSENGPLEIVAGTHRMNREHALGAIVSRQVQSEAITLGVGDVLIRHPWALHRGTPNKTEVPRPLLTIRYVRRWYCDHSREVNAIPVAVWRSMDANQQAGMRFPVEMEQR